MSGSIVVGADGSQAARSAVEWAVDDAYRMHAPVRIVHALDRWPYRIVSFHSTGEPDPLTRSAERILAEAAHLARERRPGVEVTTEIVDGHPAAVLCEQAKDAVEIVIGNRGLGGFAGALLGPVSHHVAGQAHCPVVVVREGPREPYDEVVVGVDESKECEPALAYAFAQADLRGVMLRAVHAWHLPQLAYADFVFDVDEVRTTHHRILAGRLVAFEPRYPDVTVVEYAPRAHPVEILVEASDTADLVVVGSHGRGALAAALLGSVSRGVLHHARCAVAVVRS
ncbi:universal stress protein [Nonomuraea sp. NPDC050536]|uniref:universal stress protein n=1 Tax=Nonomuraea sp. NPDC050536 TaxID=3364366 RepID=UPI0037C643E5